MSRYTVSGWMVIVILLMGTTLHAQGIFDGVLEKAKKSAEQKTRDRVNQSNAC